MWADVIIVGAGLAGMTAALAAEQAGADVILVDRGPIGTGTNSALANGVFSGPDSAEAAAEYVKTVVQIGKRLNRLSYVKQVAREAPAAVEFLNSLGLEIAHTRGRWSVRSPRPEVIPGITLVRRVAERVLERARIRVERGVRVTRLLRTSGRAAGVRGFDLSGRAREVRGSAVVLACGGAGAIYAKHDNQGTILGQGYHLAAEAGLDLWDMEFVQFYPIVLQVRFPDHAGSDHARHPLLHGRGADRCGRADGAAGALCLRRDRLGAAWREPDGRERAHGVPGVRADRRPRRRGARPRPADAGRRSDPAGAARGGGGRAAGRPPRLATAPPGRGLAMRRGGEVG